MGEKREERTVFDFTEIEGYRIICNRTGTIDFTLRETNFFEEGERSHILFVEELDGVFFSLERTGNSAKYIRCNQGAKTRICTIDLEKFRKSKNVMVRMTWTLDKAHLFLVDADNQKIKEKVESVESESVFRKGPNGSYFQIGDSGVKVSGFKFSANNKALITPWAIELADFRFERIKEVLDHCDNIDIGKGFFALTISQQSIVMMTTLFEVFCRERFLELEKSRLPALSEMYRLVPKDLQESIADYCTNCAFTTKISPLRIFVEDRRINFQNWDNCKRAYNKVFDIKFGEIEIDGIILENIQKVLRHRHKIIHTKDESSFINDSGSFAKNPEVINIAYVKKRLEDFQTFIGRLNAASRP